MQTPKLSPSSSLQAPAHSRTASDGAKSLPSRPPLNVPAPPASLAFGWGTIASDTSTPTSVRPPSLMRQSFEASSIRSGSSRPPSICEAGARPSLQLASPKPLPEAYKASGPIQRLQGIEKDSDDDDDEWGEMVASPVTEVRPASGFFGGSFNHSTASLSATSASMPPVVPDASSTFNAVSFVLNSTQSATHTNQSLSSSAAPTDVWDFSAFDTTPAAPAIPPTKTSRPRFDFDTPLPSPVPSMPSRTNSPAASIRHSTPGTPPMASRSGSPVADFQRAPTPPLAFRPQHSSKSSLSLVRPSPLHHVLTPELAISLNPPPEQPVVPKNLSSLEPVRPLPPKTVSFAEDGEDFVDDGAVRRIVDMLPDLSYMLR